MSKKTPTPETTAPPAGTATQPPEATAPATGASSAKSETTAPPADTNTTQATGGNAALVVGATPSPLAALTGVGFDLAAPGPDSTAVFDVEQPQGEAPPAGISLHVTHPVKHDGTLYLGDVSVSAALAEIFRALGVVAD